MAFSLLLPPFCLSNGTNNSFARSRRHISSFRPLKCVSVLRVSAVPNPTDFAKAAKCGNLIPLHSCIFSDQLTPVIAYRCLVEEGDRDAPSFLFESVEPGPPVSTVGRYSVAGANPSLEIVARENKVSIMDHQQGTLTEEIVDDPMVIPREISKRWKPQLNSELPDAFCGGWVGYFSYDTVRYVENKRLPFSRAPKDDRNLPDIHLGLYDDVIIIDHVKKKVHVIHWVRTDRYTSVENAHSDGIRQLQKLVERIQDVDCQKLSGGLVQLENGGFGSALINSNMTREEYRRMVSKAKEHIATGDLFQVVMSQRFKRRTSVDPFKVYRALRVVNQSQYMTYLQARGCTLVSSSPEVLTRVNKKRIIHMPLTGKMRRGRTAAEDEMLEMKLRNDPKLIAEHITLVSSARNDIEKVAIPGSVTVEKLMNVKKYSRVMHLSSRVTGELRDGLSCWDALQAALPLGIASGAPKVEAMEVIDNSEVARRGPYGGGLGSVSFTGELDIALSQQTMVFQREGLWNRSTYSGEGINGQRGEWIAHIQAGGSIVAESDPDDEYWECYNKAAALARVIDLAEQLFPSFGVISRELEYDLAYK